VIIKFVKSRLPVLQGRLLSHITFTAVVILNTSNYARVLCLQQLGNLDGQRVTGMSDAGGGGGGGPTNVGAPIIIIIIRLIRVKQRNQNSKHRTERM